MASESELIERAIKQAGCKRQNAIFLVVFGWGTNGGTFTADFNGQVTDSIAFPPSAEQFKDALESLVTIGANGVEVQGPMGGPYQIEMVGGNAGQVVPDLVIDGSLLTPSQTPIPEILQQGDSGKYKDEAEALWTDNASAATSNLRFLLTKLGLIELRLGRASNQTDVLTGQANRTDVKQSQEFNQIESLWQRTQEAINKEYRIIAQSGSVTSGGVMRIKTPNGLPFGQMGLDENYNVR